ncbi:YueI family protein [Lactobacillus sp. DCY120]|uniref:YueI family protein n=1 Tax=Bombilactobacillus apium TaxID=2675299 RepID=A0A850R6J9_9LACO|nr:YueI family protein [Bombilactobacillus apium]NVY96447.1 YueI family protein [Bombilactobacillus apium]
MTNLEDYLKKNVFGTPQLNPDEKRQFLGNFRERVALALTVAQLRNPATWTTIQQVMQQYPQYHLFINGRLNSTPRTKLLKLAVQLHYQFTITDQSKIRVKNQALGEQEMGLVIADDKHHISKPILLTRH